MTDRELLDLISRQAVLEIFGYVMDYWKEHAIDVEPHEIKDALIEQYEFTAKQLSELPSVNPQEQKWITVSERLPEDKQSVLVWCPQFKNIYCAYLDKEQWWIFGAFSRIVPNEVVAWQPLPEPYKAESEV